NSSFATAYTAAEAVDDTDDPTRPKWAAERLWQVAILHDIVGNPFHHITIHPTYLTKTVKGLPHTLYNDRELPSGILNNQCLGILADALEDAGCPDPEIVSHCRQLGEHVRGCFVLDLLLGKQ